MVTVTQSRREITVRSARLDYVEIDKRVAVLPTYDTTIPATPTDTKAPSTKLLASQLAALPNARFTDEATEGPFAGKVWQMYVYNGIPMLREVVALALLLTVSALAGDREMIVVDSVSRETAQEVHFTGTVLVTTPTSTGQAANAGYVQQQVAAVAGGGSDNAADLWWATTPTSWSTTDSSLAKNLEGLDTALASYSPTSHTHSGVYDPAGAAAAAQAAAIAAAAADATSKANAAVAAALASRDAAISAETSARQLADQGERQSREDADAGLGTAINAQAGRITQEISDRQGADQAVQAAAAQDATVKAAAAQSAAAIDAGNKVADEAAARQLADAGLELRGFQSLNRSFMYGAPYTTSLRVAETTQFIGNAYSATTKSLTSIVLSRVYGANPKLILHWMSGSTYPRTVGTWPAISSGTVYQSAYLDGILYFCGDFTSVGGVTRNRLAAINVADGTLSNWNPNCNGKVECIKIWNGMIVIGGSFSSVGGVTRKSLAMIDTNGAVQAWSPTAADSNSQIHGMDIIGNYLYTGGWFNTTYGYAAKWDLTQVGVGETTWNHPGNEGNAYTLAVTAVCAFGDYLIYCWESGASASAFHKDTGAKRTWTHGSTTSSMYLCKVIDGNLHIGQSISPINSYSYSIWDPNFNLLSNAPKSYIGTPYDAVKIDDVVYVANSSGGVSAWRWADGIVYPLAPSCSTTRTLHYADASKLIIAGSFTSLCGVSTSRLGAINPTDLWHRSPADTDNVVWKAKAIKSLTGQLLGAAGAETEAVVSANANGGLNTVTLTLDPSGDAVADPGDLAIAFWRDVDDVRDVSANTAYVTALEVSP